MIITGKAGWQIRTSDTPAGLKELNVMEFPGVRPYTVLLGPGDAARLAAALLADPAPATPERWFDGE